MTLASMTLAEKSKLLDEALLSLGSVLVAYSGGTDSAFLAFRAHRVLGNRALAVIADSPSLPREELAQALAFAEAWSIPTQTVRTDELDRAEYVRNDARRCFHCKDTLFRFMEEQRVLLGFEQMAFGMNLDDRGDYRPGQQAALEHRAVAPLVMAHLYKVEIRALAREAGLTLWDKPASACLASRIAYGQAVTAEKLSQVERAEAALHRMGFSQARVRHHGDLARVEIARGDLPRALSMQVMDEITSALKPLGFTFVTLDTEGYRSGSMNAVLPASAITMAGQGNARAFEEK